MATHVRWMASGSTSCFHAAAAILDGRALVDRPLHDALAEPAAELGGWLESKGVKPRELLAHLLPLSAEIDANGELARVALTKLLGVQGAGRLTQGLSGLLTSLENGFLRVHADALEELDLRSRPLREQWEARGPGLLASLARHTEAQLLPPQADVVLVQPVLGGYGEAWPLYNRVQIEAVLANPHAELPEVVRLGWLLAQLELDRPANSELLGNLDRRRLFGLAMAPPALAAAAEAELTGPLDPLLRHALAAWQLDTSAAGTLAEWWGTYLASRPPWPVALKALAAMLEPPAGGS